MTGYRFFDQALETFLNVPTVPGFAIDAYNRSVDESWICPTVITRPEGFKTAIVVVVKKHGDM